MVKILREARAPLTYEVHNNANLDHPYSKTTPSLAESSTANEYGPSGLRSAVRHCPPPPKSHPPSPTVTKLTSVVP